MNARDSQTPHLACSSFFVAVSHTGVCSAGNDLRSTGRSRSCSNGAAAAGVKLAEVGIISSEKGEKEKERHKY